MKEIGSASIAYSLVLFLVCVLLIVLYFCECGQNRGEMLTSSGSSDLITVVSTEGFKSKLLTRHEVPWPLREISVSWKDKLKTSVPGNSTITKQETRERNCSSDFIDGDESDISQPDKIYART